MNILKINVGMLLKSFLRHTIMDTMFPIIPIVLKIIEDIAMNCLTKIIFLIIKIFIIFMKKILFL